MLQSIHRKMAMLLECLRPLRLLCSVIGLYHFLIDTGSLQQVLAWWLKQVLPSNMLLQSKQIIRASVGNIASLKWITADPFHMTTTMLGQKQSGWSRNRNEQMKNYCNVLVELQNLALISQMVGWPVLRTRKWTKLGSQPCNSLVLYWALFCTVRLQNFDYQWNALIHEIWCHA